MNTSNPRMWIIGGLLASLAVLALGWTFLISPRMSAVAATQEQTVQLDDQAIMIANQAAQLQRQAQDLPAQIRALRRIQTKIPASVDVPALLRDIQTAGRVNRVRIDSLAPGQITVFTVETPEAAAPADTSAPEASPDAPKPAPQPTPTDLGQGKLPQGVGLSYVPVSISATGDFADLERFTARIESLQRAYLITGVQLARGTADAESPKANPLTLTMETRVFVANDRLRNLPDQALQEAGGL